MERYLVHRICSDRKYHSAFARREGVRRMYGAIIGDIIGSTLEYKGRKDYDFQIFLPGSNITDDTIMTIAVAQR